MSVTELAEMATAVLTSLGGGGLIVFSLSGYLGKRWADSSLEKQRQEHAELNLQITHQLGLLTEQTKHAHQIRALEHQVRFSNLHEARAQKIAELYERIVEQSVACQRYVYHLTESNRQEGFIELEKGFADFYLFSEASRIYLPEHVCGLLEKLISTIRKPVIDVFVYGGTDNHANDAVREEKKRAFMDAFKSFEAQIPEAKKALEDEFRKLLGVENSSPPFSTT